MVLEAWSYFLQKKNGKKNLRYRIEHRPGQYE